LWLNCYLSRLIAVACNPNTPDILGQRVGPHAFRPLDDYHSFFVGQQLVEIDGVRRAGAFVQTIKIDMVKLKPPGVRVYQRERRTRNVFFIDTQCRADAFDENSFARAQWTTKQQDFAAFESCPDLVTVVECLFGR
jgi:hypothetical protein